MATVEIRDIIDSETGKTIFPRTHIDAVIGLSDSSFFEAVSDGGVTSVKLKSGYAGLWAEGWISAGGVGSGSGSGGGGGLIDTVYTWTELQAMSSAPTDDTTSATNANSVYQILQLVRNTYTKAQVDSLLSNLSGMNFVSAVTTWQDNTVDFTFNNGDVTKVDLNHEHSNYVPKTTQINGHSLSQDITLSATELGVASWAMDSGSSGTTIPFERLPVLYTAGTQVTDTATQRTLLGVSAISYDLSSTGLESSLIKWEAGIGAWHVLGNLYADGWIAAGGIGSSSSGVTSLYDLTEVLDSTTPSANQVFYFNGSKWTSISLKTINNESLLGSGDITISGGGSTVSWGTESGNTVVLDVEGSAKTLLLSTALSGYALESWVQSQGYLTSYTETDPTVPSWAKQSSLQFSALPALYTAGTTVTNSPSQTTLLGVSAISNGLSSTGSEASLIKWENNAWHFYGNLYADGWISAGGIGTGGSYVSVLDDIDDVSVSSATNGQLLKYDGSEWVNTSLKTINGSSLLGSGDITISGGGSAVSVTSLAADSSADSRIASITVDGTTTYLYNDVKWGTYDSTNYTIPVTINGTTRTLCVNGYSSGGGVSSEGLTIYDLSDNGTTTAGTWKGANSDIEALTDGLMVRYKITKAGSNTTTLNVNGLGAKTVYRYGSTKLTTQYGVGSYITLYYSTSLNSGSWILANDRDSDAVVRQYATTASDNYNYPVLMRYNSVAPSGNYEDDVTQFDTDVFINPSTGLLTANGFVVPNTDGFLKSDGTVDTMTAQPSLQAPIIEVQRGWLNDGTAVPGKLKARHPGIGVLPNAEFVLMVMAKRRGRRVDNTKSWSRGGWGCAQGTLGQSKITFSAAVPLDTIRLFIIRNYVCAQNTAERLTGYTLAQFQALTVNVGFGHAWSGETVADFLVKTHRSRLFGIALRYENPAFTELVSGTLSDHTTSIRSGGEVIQRWIYTDVAPFRVYVHDASLDGSGTNSGKVVGFELLE